MFPKVWLTEIFGKQVKQWKLYETREHGNVIHSHPCGATSILHLQESCTQRLISLCDRAWCVAGPLSKQRTAQIICGAHVLWWMGTVATMGCAQT